jgi:hypothetical protein
MLRFGAIEAPSIVGSASPWLPMGCAKTIVTMLPDNYHQDAHGALADPSATARGPHRSLPVVPSIQIEGTTGRLRGDSGGTTALSAVMG